MQALVVNQPSVVVSVTRSCLVAVGSRSQRQLWFGRLYRSRWLQNVGSWQADQSRRKAARRSPEFRSARYFRRVGVYLTGYVSQFSLFDRLAEPGAEGKRRN